MMRLLLLSAFAPLCVSASAQLMIYGVGDPAAAALTHLNGPNVVLMNAFSQTIDPQQVGVFSDSTASIGLDSGLVMSTGIVYGLLGPNNIPNMSFGGGFGMYDPDLQLMSLPNIGVMYDPGIIQMDLVPAGDTLEVRYVFGSEEYDEYVCTDKDDRMGLFLSGPGLSGTFSGGAINMATLPASGLPVTVNTVNKGSSGSEGNMALCNMNLGWEADTIHYINNDFGLGTQLDGYTVVLTARAVVVPGETYHLKIAITDLTDGNFDSAVFLPEGAIRCTELSTSLPAVPLTERPAFRYDAAEGTVQLSGARSGPVHLEAFDAAGRLLERRTMTQQGAGWVTALHSAGTGLVVLRAYAGDEAIIGRVFIH